MQTLDIGFVGLGVMGEPMATHLTRVGHRLHLHDVDPAVADALAEALGGAARTAATPAALAEGCDIVITMLPNGQVVQQVALGESGLLHGLRLDPTAMVELLDEATGGSWITRNHIRQRVLSRSFDDPFKLELMLKDIGIALELGRESQLPMPLSALGQQLWRAAALAAGPGVSVCELARWVEQQAGTQLTPGAAAA